jgi:hypothetical protein
VINENFELFESLNEVEELRGSKLLIMIFKTRGFIVQFIDFGIDLHKNILVSFNKLFYIRSDDIFAIFLVIAVIFMQTNIAYQFLMIEAKSCSSLFRMSIAEYIRYFDILFNLFPCMLVGANLNGLFDTFRCTVVRGTEKTLELAFDDNFFGSCLDHL